MMNFTTLLTALVSIILLVAAIIACVIVSLFLGKWMLLIIFAGILLALSF